MMLAILGLASRTLLMWKVEADPVWICGTKQIFPKTVTSRQSDKRCWGIVQT